MPYCHHIALIYAFMPRDVYSDFHFFAPPFSPQWQKPASAALLHTHRNYLHPYLSIPLVCHRGVAYQWKFSRIQHYKYLLNINLGTPYDLLVLANGNFLIGSRVALVGLTCFPQVKLFWPCYGPSVKIRSFYSGVSTNRILWSQFMRNYRCIALGWSQSGWVIKVHSDHGTSNEPTILFPRWICWFLWFAII